MCNMGFYDVGWQRVFLDSGLSQCSSNRLLGTGVCYHEDERISNDCGSPVEKALGCDLMAASSGCVFMVGGQYCVYTTLTHTSVTGVMSPMSF